jgi:hypothetical protein
MHEIRRHPLTVAILRRSVKSCRDLVAIIMDGSEMPMFLARNEVDLKPVSVARLSVCFGSRLRFRRQRK